MIEKWVVGVVAVLVVACYIGVWYWIFREVLKPL